MAMEFENVWIHLAGNPPSVMKQVPPYWRYRLGHEDEEHLITGWEIVGGTFDATNNTQGTELGASYLLWYAIYGTLRLHDTHDHQSYARIVLRSASSPLPDPFAVTLNEYPKSHIKIYGAPDRVQHNSPLWWRCTVDGDSFDLAQWRVRGPAQSLRNCGPGEDIDHANPLQRLWLNFHGSIKVDSQHHGLIEL